MNERIRPSNLPARPAARGVTRSGIAALCAGIALKCARARPAATALAVATTIAAATPGTAAPVATPGPAGLPPAQWAELEAWTHAIATEATTWPGGRVEIELGRPDPRLRLASCAQVEPYLPAGSRPLGRSRVGLRCADGMVRWNVSLPVVVRVLAPAPVLRDALPAGTELRPGHFTDAEVDWADHREPPLADAAAAAGQRLLRALPAGSAVRRHDLQTRQWFAAGERVRVDAVGAGWRVSTEGRALSRGLDGQPVRVRTEGGRVVHGVAVAERLVEVAL